jgi:hypothetical protein
LAVGGIGRAALGFIEVLQALRLLQIKKLPLIPGQEPPAGDFTAIETGDETMLRQAQHK